MKSGRKSDVMLSVVDIIATLIVLKIVDVKMTLEWSIYLEWSRTGGV